MLEHVAGNVRGLRQAAGLSQQALADASGVSRRMLVAIESGDANVSLNTLDRIAEALGVTFARIARAPPAAPSGNAGDTDGGMQGGADRQHGSDGPGHPTAGGRRTRGAAPGRPARAPAEDLSADGLPARIEALAWRGRDPASKAVLLASVPAAREVEFWSWTLMPGERYAAEADPAGWHEMFYVVEGQLTLALPAGEHVIAAGDFFVFASNRDYAYRNDGPGPLRFIRNVVF